MKRKVNFHLFGLLCCLIFYNTSSCQTKIPEDTLTQRDFNKFYIISGVVYGGSLIALNQLWYADYPRSSFHTFNDNQQWLQVDKVGHLYSAFTLSKLNYALLNGNRESDNTKAIIVSAMTSFAFLTAIELMDGFSENWGFSWGDMAANSIGTGLFLGQQLLFKKQILQIKYSYHPTEYRELRPNVLGENEIQGSLKDYNGQTYWASLNLNGICNRIEPRWLSVSFGYGAEGMIYADQKNGGLIEDPFRQIYISLDVDFEQIRTKKKWMKSIFKVANCIKVPFPTVEFSGNGQSSFYWLYF